MTTESLVAALRAECSQAQGRRASLIHATRILELLDEHAPPPEPRNPQDYCTDHGGTLTGDQTWMCEDVDHDEPAPPLPPCTCPPEDHRYRAPWSHAPTCPQHLEPLTFPLVTVDRGGITYPTPTTYDASQLFPHRTLVNTHPDTDLRMVCRHPGCSYWIEASSTPQMDQLLREHARTHQETQQ